MNKQVAIETIAAQATPPGRGGVGIIRVSGPLTSQIAKAILDELPQPRLAHYSDFSDGNGDLIDKGLALFFPAPNSFTGEDVLELQGHGGPALMDWLLQRTLSLGARLARPGEFSERAFLNDKIDLTQAEAIADLIDSTSNQAVRSALRSLQGDFSQKINDLLKQLITLRIYVEAAIDFPEEEIDFLSDGKIEKDLNKILEQVIAIHKTAKQGSLLREGMTLVIAGQPNAGKSSLLNALSGVDRAIVTSEAGTTRDVLKERINLDGIPLHLIDTAGLRDSENKIEQEGVRRAWLEICQADRVLLLIDDRFSEKENVSQQLENLQKKLPSTTPITLVYNKIDLTGRKANIKTVGAPLVGTLNEDSRIEPTNKFSPDRVSLSLKTGEGIDAFKTYLKKCVGYESTEEGSFSARRRHLNLLEKVDKSLQQALTQLTRYKAGELLAEELRQAQQWLSEITGEFHADDLLGEVFSSFCVGK